jgi:hypothetical protein
MESEKKERIRELNKMVEKWGNSPSSEDTYESKLRALLSGLRALNIDELIQKDDEYFFVLGGNISRVVRRKQAFQNI